MYVIVAIMCVMCEQEVDLILAEVLGVFLVIATYREYRIESKQWRGIHVPQDHGIPPDILNEQIRQIRYYMDLV